MFILDLFKLRILTPARIIRLLIHVFRNGVQLSNVIHMCAHRDALALKHRETSLTYKELFRATASVSGYIYDIYKVKQGSAVLVIVDNSIPSIVLLLALSALGCNVHIFPPMIDYDHFRRTVDFSAYDFIFSGVEIKYDYYDTAPLHFITPVWGKAVAHKGYEPFVKQLTSIAIFTSGSTGTARNVKRTNTLWQYLNVISDVVRTLHLHDYRSVLLPVPVYHSYGLSALFLSLMLNKRIILVNNFEPAAVANEVKVNNVEVAVFIPQMLNRILNEDMAGLRCIISCADVLPAIVFQNARSRFGDIIFNLYGTSETGLATVATPEMLAARPDTIGRPIRGCKLKLEDENGTRILHVESGFAFRRGFVRTGDIASADEQGWYYIHGRADDLMVINGVNVYPNELTEMAYGYEGVLYAGVKAFANEDGFRKIRMILLVKPGVAADEHQFKAWWISRYGTKFLPAVVEFKTDDSYIKLMQR